MHSLGRFDVAVAGGGFAGVACARRLERLLPKPYRIALVSSENYFLFQPLLPEVVGASLEPTHVVSPLRHLLKRTHILRAEVTGIELPAGDGAIQLHCAVDDLTRIPLQTDRLVLALGSVVDVGRFPGMAEHALLMKSVGDALALRDRAIERLERAAVEPDPAQRAGWLQFVVVGAGFSGVETAAELHDLLRAVRRYYPPLQRIEPSVTVVEATDRVLPELDPRLAAHAQRVLARRGVRFELQAPVRAVAAEGVHLADGRLLPARTVVCTIGNSPHAVLRALGLRLERGRLCVEPTLRVPGQHQLWAIGDCAQVPDGHGGIAPPTAQFATRQGDRAARNLAAAMAGRAERPFRHRSLGQLASLGHFQAVAALGRLRVTGIFAWWLWRTVYLLKLPRLDRKLRVVVDWTLRLFFPRDLTVISPRRSQPVTHLHLQRDEILFRQGDPSTAFYVVADGAIELTQRDGAGRVLLQETLRSGDHFGEGSLLGKRTRQTTARALEPTTVLAFGASGFDSVVGRFRRLRELLQRTSTRFRPASELLARDPGAAWLERPVGEVMRSPAVTLGPTATLGEALAAGDEHGFASFPVVGADGALLGICTRTDLHAALARGLGLRERVTEFCTAQVRTVEAGAPARLALERMRRHDVKRLVVVDSAGRVAGIVSLRDLLPGPRPVARGASRESAR